MPGSQPTHHTRLLHLSAATTGLLLAVMLSFGVAGPASAQQGELAQVRDREERIAAQVARHNGEIDRLLGELSAARQREQKASAALASVQAELHRAAAELAAKRLELEGARAELKLAVKRLEQLLVDIYKSNDPDALSLIFSAETFDDLVTQAELVERLSQSEGDAVEGVRALREQIATTVAGLEAERERIAEARDRAQLRRDSLAAARGQLEARQSALASARAERKSVLAGLRDRESRLLERLTAAPEPPASPDGDAPAAPQPPASAPNPGQNAILIGGQAIPPKGAPPAVVSSIQAANAIASAPYLWGGGHGSFDAPGYDCSGAVSYSLHGGGFLSAPLDSTGLSYWGQPGSGKWITVYANSGHAYAVIAGLRWDTSGTGGTGPSWQLDASARAGFTARHPAGY